MIEAPNNHGFSYRLEAPSPERPLGATVVWSLAAELQGHDARLANQLQLPGYDWQGEAELVSRICNRDPHNFPQVKYIIGRSVVVPEPKPSGLSFGGVPYDSFEISGFGAQNFIKHPETAHEGGASVDLLQPVVLPSGHNYMEDQPGIGTTYYVVKGQRVQHLEAYNFTGAYSLKEASDKVAATLEGFRQSQLTGFPILAPLPVFIGRYEGVTNDRGEHGHFIAYRVPYEGARTGIAPFSSAAEIPGFLEEVFQSVGQAAVAARFLHDGLKVTHNNFLPSNWYMDPSARGPACIADWATIRKFDPNAPDAMEQRANDLGRPLYEYFSLIRAFSDDFHIDHSVVLKLIEGLQNTINGYFNSDLVLPLKPEMLTNDVAMMAVVHPEVFLAKYLKGTRSRLTPLPPELRLNAYDANRQKYTAKRIAAVAS